MKYIAFIIVSLLLGCSNKQDASIKTSPDNQFHVSDLQIHLGRNLLADTTALSTYLQKEKLSLSRITDLARNPKTGNLFIANLDENIIKIDRSGRPLFTLKKHGKGPGEFTWAYSLKVRNDRLYIFDMKQKKISIYGLDGHFIRDIIPDVANVSTFEVTKDGRIILPNVYPQMHNGALFIIFDETGKQIDQFGDSHIVQEDYNATKITMGHSLSLSGNGHLLLTFNITGNIFSFDLENQTLTHTFDIRNGPEWEKTVEAEKNRSGYPQRIQDVCFTSDGRIIMGAGGLFKNHYTVGMQYGPDGAFLGRIFGNEQLKYIPTHMVMVNDTTLWFYNTVTYQLSKMYLRPAGYKEKE